MSKYGFFLINMLNLAWNGSVFVNTTITIDKTKIDINDLISVDSTTGKSIIKQLVNSLLSLLKNILMGLIWNVIFKRHCLI